MVPCMMVKGTWLRGRRVFSVGFPSLNRDPQALLSLMLGRVLTQFLLDLSGNSGFGVQIVTGC